MFGAILGAVLPALVGGLLDRDSAEDQQDDAQGFSQERYDLERGDFLDDRKHSEQYARSMLKRDRKYFSRMMKGDRRYTERMLGKDRRYMEGVRREDRARFGRAQDRNQRLSDRGAEATADSRGVDFQKLRDDAIAAGFNPLTAMSMAHAYSTETDYTNKREVWNGDTAYRISGDGRRGGGGTSGGTGGPMAPGAPSGGFMSSGGGYQSAFNPALSAGGFIAQAMERGIDTYFNTPDPAEEQAANVMSQVQAGIEEQRRARAATPYGGFGYDLSKIEPYNPAVSINNPPMHRSNGPDAVAGMSPSDDLTTPSKVPLKTPYGDLPPNPGWSDASAAEERYGDFGGSVYGAARAADEFPGYAVDMLKKELKWPFRYIAQTGVTPSGGPLSTHDWTWGDIDPEDW